MPITVLGIAFITFLPQCYETRAVIISILERKITRYRELK